MSDVFIARQPILDRDCEVGGYELLYQHREPPYLDDHAPSPPADDGKAATAQLVLGALTEIGLDRVVGDEQAWISVATDFVRDGLVSSLPRGRVVLELRAEQLLVEGVLELVGGLRGAGYGVALRDFRHTPETEQLLGYVDTIKLDLAALGPDGLQREAERCKRHEVTVVARGVATPEDFAIALGAGCDLFQGYFFCQPEVVKDRAVEPNALVLMKLAARLQDPDLQLSELERLISSDVMLSYRLLRYINSAYFGLRRQVASLMHAVALLGIENVRRWATLTTFTAVERKPRELFVTALIRARFCQLAGDERDGPPVERFTTGLFSVADALTDRPMKDVVASLPFPDRIRDALVDHAGAGRLLDCVEAIERGNFGRAARELAHPARDYTSALAWANEIAREFGAARAAADDGTVI